MKMKVTSWLVPVALLAILGVFAFLPFRVTLDCADSSGRLAQWGNYGQTFGVVAALFGWCAVLLSLYTVHEARKQSAEARNQTNAVISALKSQAEISGISARLGYLMSVRNGDLTIDQMRRVQEEIRQLNARLVELLKIGER
jgi:hypothetical protein